MRWQLHGYPSAQVHLKSSIYTPERDMEVLLTVKIHFVVLRVKEKGTKLSWESPQYGVHVERMGLKSFFSKWIACYPITTKLNITVSPHLFALLCILLLHVWIIWILLWILHCFINLFWCVIFFQTHKNYTNSTKNSHIPFIQTHQILASCITSEELCIKG